jgi:ferrochelatase
LAANLDLGEKKLMKYDAILVVSFGGPNGPNDVLPFLENVLRGRNVPRERMLAVAEHYQHFGGVSPINAQNQALIAALEQELAAHGPQLPVYWGNRNWHPMLADTLRQMRDDGVKKAIAFFTSAYSSYSGCRQYRENIIAAQEQVGPGVPAIDKLRVYYNHPGFVEPMAESLRGALDSIPVERRKTTRVLFSAHSIPLGMAANCKYETQLAETARLVAAGAGLTPEQSQCVYQSRSGPATQPWLEPDVCDVIRELPAQGITDVIIVPYGFISDHMEVLYDLDTEARDLCGELGLAMIRTPTVGTDPRFVRMIRDLIVERIEETPERSVLGGLGASHDVCPVDCCLSGRHAVVGRPA